MFLLGNISPVQEWFIYYWLLKQMRYFDEQTFGKNVFNLVLRNFEEEFSAALKFFFSPVDSFWVIPVVISTDAVAWLLL